MSLIEMLKAKKAAQATATPTPTEAPAPPLEVAPEPTPTPTPEPTPAKAKKLAPPRINSPEHDAAKAPEAPAPVEVAPAPTPEAPAPEVVELDRAGLIEAIKAGPVTVAKSRGRATADRLFASGKTIKSLIADGLAVVEDVKGGRLVTEPPVEAVPVEAVPVEALPEPTPTEAPTEAEPVTAAPTPPEEAPLGRRLVALYMRKDGRIIVEIDPAGIPE